MTDGAYGLETHCKYFSYLLEILQMHNRELQICCTLRASRNPPAAHGQPIVLFLRVIQLVQLALKISLRLTLKNRIFKFFFILRYYFRLHTRDLNSTSSTAEELWKSSEGRDFLDAERRRSRSTKKNCKTIRRATINGLYCSSAADLLRARPG